MKRFRPEDVRNFAARLATAAGVPTGDAEILARSLVDADLHGVSTHGVSRLNIYLQRIKKGLIDPKAELVVERGFGSVLTLDACNGLGQVQAVKALDLLMPRAKANGVAVATIRHSQHFGALSYYCNLAADEGMVLLAMTNCEPAMSPEGGYEAFFGTNPIAASFPTGKGFHVKIDLATSVVARGNVIAASKKKEAIPQGWALDRQGRPTTDAKEALLGTILTMAGHKGYALALMVEVFSSILSGAAVGPAIGSMYKDLDRPQNVGHFFCLLNIAAFLDPEEFKQRIDATIDQLKSSKRRPGVEEILVPGERSARNAALNEARGIAINDETLAELSQWSKDLQVPLDCAEVNSYAEGKS
ncbi:MAG TPA: Ldh family oxidoreductase [Acidobacteriaceae bacterium]|nr:Ldh family oxidoreductase [Acidobacteriaceae bacterium]